MRNSSWVELAYSVLHSCNYNASYDFIAVSFMLSLASEIVLPMLLLSHILCPFDSRGAGRLFAISSVSCSPLWHETTAVMSLNFVDIVLRPPPLLWPRLRLKRLHWSLFKFPSKILWKYFLWRNWITWTIRFVSIHDHILSQHHMIPWHHKIPCHFILSNGIPYHTIT